MCFYGPILNPSLNHQDRCYSPKHMVNPSFCMPLTFSGPFTFFLRTGPFAGAARDARTTKPPPSLGITHVKCACFISFCMTGHVLTLNDVHNHAHKMRFGGLVDVSILSTTCSTLNSACQAHFFRASLNHQGSHTPLTDATVLLHRPVPFPDPGKAANTSQTKPPPSPGIAQ